jgi:predicted transporter
MDTISILWQLGILASIIVFDVKLGLATGLANLSKKYLATICVGYGGEVLILAQISSYYTKQIIDMIYTYNSLFFIIMAIIMILAGIFTIREWKVYQKNTSNATCAAIIAPCPCCFGSIIVSILLVAPTIGIGAADLSKYVALALVLTIIITYFASNIFVKYVDKPYPIILGNFMLFLGCYFLLSALVIPNIAAIINKSMSYINIVSFNSLIGSIIGLIILIVIGFIISNKDNLLS